MLLLNILIIQIILREKVEPQIIDTKKEIKLISPLKEEKESKEIEKEETRTFKSSTKK
ncbi:MAG: hypothetical protein V8R16_04530 [Bacilli bacterium]